MGDPSRRGYTARRPAARRRRFTTSEYHVMLAEGILRPLERVELLAGEIFEAPVVGSRHAGCVMRLTRWFCERVGERAVVSIRSPVELSDLSQPEPDLALLAPRDDFYSDRHPLAEEVLLLVEVADVSYDFDRRFKLGLYAQAGVREVWIVALGADAVQVFRRPQGREYRIVRRARDRETVRPVALPGLELTVAELLG
ncbi:MAG: Uma2 family endonuclease [Thermoanaerobaculia bacterium]|nr:Uma2 family endonuclease [Thermoanaerobaculia bacterium]